MSEQRLFSYLIYEEQTHLEERELSAFINTVTRQFGLDQARSAAEIWLEEADLIDAPPLSTNRDWRAVTIAASARLERFQNPCSRIEQSREVAFS